MVTISSPSKKRSRQTPRHHVIVQANSAADTLSSLDESLIKDLYRLHGAILFRGFPLDVEHFAGFTSTFCSHSIVNTADKRDLVDAKNRIQTVNRGEAPFPLHPELSPEPWRPDVCFFGCLTPPETAGETTFCDGVQIARKLAPDTAKTLANKRLRYTLTATAEDCRFWLGTAQPSDDQLEQAPATCPYRFSRIGANIMRSYTTPVLHKPMFTDKLAFANFLLFARYMRNDRAFPVFDDGRAVPDHLVADIKNTSDKLTYVHRWQANDLIMLDNTRFMHGRNLVIDASRRLILTYFGYLNFARPGTEEPIGAPWRIPGGMDSLRAQG